MVNEVVGRVWIMCCGKHGQYHPEVNKLGGSKWELEVYYYLDNDFESAEML